MRTCLQKGWPLTAVTARPLPAGEYRFYYAEQPASWALCNAMPEFYRTRMEVILTVTAPAGTLHEAFFDPEALASGVGVEGMDGTFTAGSTSTSISGLKWDNSSVTLTLSSYASLSGYELDFIDLDGTVSTSLAISDATEDSTAGTLTWSVPTQPWQVGDQLMLRIRETDAAPAPMATPEPTVAPTSQS